MRCGSSTHWETGTRVANVGQKCGVGFDPPGPCICYTIKNSTTAMHRCPIFTESEMRTKKNVMSEISHTVLFIQIKHSLKTLHF